MKDLPQSDSCQHIQIHTTMLYIDYKKNMQSKKFDWAYNDVFFKKQIQRKYNKMFISANAE